MSNEDIFISTVLLLKEHMGSVLDVGGSWITSTSPLAFDEPDMVALALLEHLVVLNENDADGVWSNLLDLRSWPIFLEAGGGKIEYQPLRSTNGKEDWHLSPYGAQDFLASIGVEAGMPEVDGAASLAFFWMSLIGRTITGEVRRAAWHVDQEEEE